MENHFIVQKTACTLTAWQKFTFTSALTSFEFPSANAQRQCQIMIIHISLCLDLQVHFRGIFLTKIKGLIISAIRIDAGLRD
jgi:hypothetical protein